MHVVKLGGSLYCSKPQLKAWLAQLTLAAENGVIIIVPGGGPFADQIRTAQDDFHFSDQAAHHMAILAMAQYGILLADVINTDNTFHRVDEIKKTAPQHGLYIWLPDSSLLATQEIEQSWTVSSDSLALWLAQQLSAPCLSLVKSIQATSTHIAELTQQGIIDEGFLAMFKRDQLACEIQYADLADHFQLGVIHSALHL